MKRVIFTFSLLLCTAIALIAARQKLSYIQKSECELRNSPSYLRGKIVGTVTYQEGLSVIETRDDWSKVSSPSTGHSGWIHSSTLDTKPLKLNAGSKNAQTGASSGELALAGKGFSAAVEAEFKANNKDIDFSWVDKMEKTKISLSEIKAFLQAGSITPEEGGAQ